MKNIGFMFAVSIFSAIGCAQASRFEYMDTVSLSRNRLRPITEDVARLFVCNALDLPPDQITINSGVEAEHDLSKNRENGAQIFFIRTPKGEFVVKSSTRSGELGIASAVSKRVKEVHIPGLSFALPTHAATCDEDGSLSIAVLLDGLDDNDFEYLDTQKPFRVLQLMPKAHGCDFANLFKKFLRNEIDPPELLTAANCAGDTMGALNAIGLHLGDAHCGNVIWDSENSEITYIDIGGEDPDKETFANELCAPLRCLDLDTKKVGVLYLRLFCFLNSYSKKNAPPYDGGSMIRLLERNKWHAIGEIFRDAFLYPLVESEIGDKYYVQMTNDNWLEMLKNDGRSKMCPMWAEHLAAEQIRKTFDITHLSTTELLRILDVVLMLVNHIGDRFSDKTGEDCTGHLEAFKGELNVLAESVARARAEETA
jgi:hypothetical protein